MAMTRPVPFADLLRRHRVSRGLTQEELANRAGLSPRTISDLERGVKLTARTATIALLADALQLAEHHRAAFEAAARGRSSSPALGQASSSPAASRGVARAVATAIDDVLPQDAAIAGNDCGDHCSFGSVIPANAHDRPGRHIDTRSGCQGRGGSKRRRNGAAGGQRQQAEHDHHLHHLATPATDAIGRSVGGLPSTPGQTVSPRGEPPHQLIEHPVHLSPTFGRVIALSHFAERLSRLCVRREPRSLRRTLALLRSLRAEGIP